jgi:hypothetical protein
MLNDLPVLLKNIYQNATLTAIKSHAYLQEWKRIAGASIRSCLLVEIVIDLAQYAMHQLKLLCDHPLIQGTFLVKDLMLTAFLEVWKSKSGRYQTEIIHLEEVCAKSALLHQTLGGQFWQQIQDSGCVLIRNIRF